MIKIFKHGAITHKVVFGTAQCCIKHKNTIEIN